MIDHQKLRIKEVKLLSVVTMKILIIGNSSMTTKDKLICGVYGLIALVALPATWINNIAFMTQPTNSSAIDLAWFKKSHFRVTLHGKFDQHCHDDQNEN
jgi:hypothetical protein